MALNKQRILSELGSVVNQLQSAECGCMGKLFSDPGQESSMGAPPMQPYGGCRMGCCHGHGSSFSGEPCPPTNNQFMHRPFLGNCNPPKLYADTYNYLNKNLMQPMVNEVYNDLKSISPDNTIMNNPMASKMGLSPTNPAIAGQPGQGNMGGMAQSPMAGGSMGNPNMGGDMIGMSPGYNVNMGMGKSNASPQMGQQNQYMSQMDHSMGQMNQQTGQMSQPMGQTNQLMNQMGGMGSQIMKMMMSDKSSKPANMSMQNGQLSDSMLIDAPQSPHGLVGVTPLNKPNYGAHTTTHNLNYEQDNAGAYAQNPIAQHMSHSNAFTGNTMADNTQQQMFQNNMQQNNLPLNNMAQNNMNSNPGGMVQNQPMGSGSQQMAANRYGQHTQGVKKFSEMFPGVMQGDLGFDPMAIAIQMNPANQQQAALSTMEKLMSGNKITNSANSSIMQPVINAANAASASINAPSGAAPNQQSGVPSAPNANQLVMQNQAPVQNQMQPVQQEQQLQQQQQVNDPNAAAPINQVPQQQVYTANVVPVQYQQSPNQQYQQQSPNQQYQQQSPNQQYQQPSPNQQYQQQSSNQQYQQQSPNQQYLQQPQQYQQQPQQYQQQPQQYQTQQHYQSLPQTQRQIVDPNTGAVMNSPNIGSGYEQVSEPNAQMQQDTRQTEPLKQMIMDPIFPADKKNGAFYSHHVKHLRNYHYNTLGQPIQMMDAKMYHPAEPPLPQTLSPQSTVSKPRNLHKTFSNVKNTVSKTSIIGNGTVGRTPSRNQLQHLYNQYKGSQSFTQQNINAPVQYHSQSEGRLNENVNAVRPRPVPVEKVGGDTIANNVVVNQEVNKFEPPAAMPMGDVVATNKPQGDGLAEKAPPMRTLKGRNGLQDMVYSSSPTSAAWSFHGNNHMPYSTGYRFRTKVR